MKNGKMRKFLGNQSHDYEIVQDHLLDRPLINISEPTTLLTPSSAVSPLISKNARAVLLKYTQLYATRLSDNTYP
uniref:hypothetical protein n=1 Tax=Escherichia coli TaxID=562 RepID=UPI002B23F0E1